MFGSPLNPAAIFKNNFGGEKGGKNGHKIKTCMVGRRGLLQSPGVAEADSERQKQRSGALEIGAWVGAPPPILADSPPSQKMNMNSYLFIGELNK